MANLKTALRERGLETTGFKSDLIARLTGGVKASVPTTTADDDEPPARDETVPYVKPPRPHICLNMIVRNEAHVILECLESVRNWISSFAILDTGSKDNTVELIRKYFHEQELEGTIEQIPGVSAIEFDFGARRTQALQLAQSRPGVDWVYVMDADNIWTGDIPIFKILNRDPRVDALRLPYRPEDKSTLMFRETLFRNRADLGWYYDGVRHEFLGSKITTHRVDVPAKYVSRGWIVDRRKGARNQDPQKFIIDALALELYLSRVPESPRNVFYAAQSWKAAGNYVFAMARYKQRTKMASFWEEVFVSYFEIARCMQLLMYTEPEILAAFEECHRHFPKRMEPLHEMANIHEYRENWKKAYEYRRLGVDLPYPTECLLWVDQNLYKYFMLDRTARCAFFAGDYEQSVIDYDRLLYNTPDVPERLRAQYLDDAHWPLDKLHARQHSVQRLQEARRELQS